MKKLVITALFGTLLAAPVAALEPLAQNSYVNDRLVAARIADRIRNECPSIKPRMVYAYGEASKLFNWALSKGYSRTQINGYLDSKPDRQRIYGVAETYLNQNGAKKGDAQSYCRIGQKEMAGKTYIGSFLSAK